MKLLSYRHCFKYSSTTSKSNLENAVARFLLVFEKFTKNEKNVEYFDDVNDPSLFELIEAFLDY